VSAGEQENPERARLHEQMAASEAERTVADARMAERAVNGCAIATAAGFAAGAWIRVVLAPVCVAFRLGRRVEQVRRRKASEGEGRHARGHLRLIKGGCRYRE
jgi:hypothetical protein